jgi:hypothetical protein
MADPSALVLDRKSFDGLRRLTKAEERQDEHDDDDQADQVNQAAHGFLPDANGRALAHCLGNTLICKKFRRTCTLLERCAAKQWARHCEMEPRRRTACVTAHGVF